MAFIEEFRGNNVSRYAIGDRGYICGLYASKPISIFYSIENR